MPRLVDKNLTDSMVRAAPAKDRRYDLFDGNTRGFGLRVGTGGKKSFFVMRRVDGQMKRHTLGTYPALTLAEARTAAARELVRMASGEEEKPTKGRLFRNVFEDWIARDQSENRSLRQVRSAMEVHVLPKLAKRNIEDIKKGDIIRLIDSIADSGKGTQANRVLAHVKRMFSWAAKRDLVRANPAADVEKVWREVSRSRVLSPAEICQIMRGARALDYPFGPYIQLLLLVAQRRDEVAEMRWSEIDLAAKTWTIPGSRTKNRDGHQVHFSNQAMDILQVLPRFEDTDFVFPATSSRTEGGRRPISGFSKAKLRLDASSGVVGWRFHDFRRAFASHATERLGVSPAVADKVLAHRTGVVRGVAAVYNRAELLGERREALQLWADWLDELTQTHEQ